MTEIGRSILLRKFWLFSIACNRRIKHVSTVFLLDATKLIFSSVSARNWHLAFGYGRDATIILYLVHPWYFLSYFHYSYISNKRRDMFILFEEIFQALRSYSRPYVYFFFEKNHWKFGWKSKKVAIFSNFFV